MAIPERDRSGGLSSERPSHRGQSRPPHASSKTVNTLFGWPISRLLTPSQAALARRGLAVSLPGQVRPHPRRQSALFRGPLDPGCYWHR